MSASRLETAAIVAMSENRVIGRRNQMPWHLPEDLKHFKAVTLGKPVIMGRKTFESIGRPLPGRLNIVISRNFAADGVVVTPNLAAAISAGTASADTPSPTEIMIIGGGQVYAESLPLLDRIYLTQVNRTISDGDAFFPALPAGEWRETARDDRDGFSFITLDRVRAAG